MNAHIDHRILEAITAAVQKAIDDVGLDKVKDMSFFCADPIKKTGQSNLNREQVAA